MPAICPYCNTPVSDEEQESRSCPDCGTRHHLDCWEENNGCTVYGCVAAPPDEPKLTVQASDFAQPSAPPPPPPPPYHFAVPPPPPPPPAVPAIPTVDFAFSFGGYTHRPGANQPPMARLLPLELRITSKNRTSYVLLGVFLGAFGAHNFYAGYTYRAVAQLAITLCTLFTGAFVSWIWALVEVCVVERDHRNILMN
ncbi:MAG: NINE protein [Bryobacteraceae bacterium]